MPEPTRVWMVQLDRSPDDIEGTLSLEGTTLRFDSPSVGIRTIALETVRRVTAFYFSKPPPLHPEEPTPGVAPPTLMGPFNRNRPASRRKQRRRNAGYLANASNLVDIDLRAWVKETRAAVAAARSKGD